MAIDMFFKLDGIKGEATDSKHKDEIDIESFTFGVHQTGSSHRGGHGLGAGRAEFQDVMITKYADKASPPLMEHCAKGAHIKTAQITVRKAGGKQEEGYKVHFHDLIISSFTNTGSSEKDSLVETISLNYSGIQFEYAPQSADGTLGGSVKGGWHLRENKPM